MKKFRFAIGKPGRRFASVAGDLRFGLLLLSLVTCHSSLLYAGSVVSGGGSGDLSNIPLLNAANSYTGANLQTFDGKIALTLGGTWGTGYTDAIRFQPNEPGLGEFSIGINRMAGIGSATRAIANANTTDGLPTVTSDSAAFTTVDLYRTISGTGIPASSYIGVVNSTTSVGLSSTRPTNTPVNATATGTATTLTIGGSMDNQIWFGYNGPTSPNYVATDDSFGFNLEKSYYTGSGVRQGELYFYARSADGLLSNRMFGLYPKFDLHTSLITMSTSVVQWGPNENEPWLTLSSGGGTPSAVTGALQFVAGIASYLDFAQLRFGESTQTRDFIVRGGSGILGLTGADVGRIMPGYATNSVGTDWGAAGAGGATNITLYLGDSASYASGIRHNASTEAFEYLDAIGGTWKAPLGQWTSSLGIGSGSGTPAKTLHIVGTGLRIDAGGGIYYDILRNGGTGYLDFTGTQSDFIGYNFNGPGTFSGNLTVTGTSTLSGAIIYGVQSLSGAGAVNLTTLTTKLTTTGIAQVLTLANGTEGQVKIIVYGAEGGGTNSAVLTPTTMTGGVTITFTAIGNAVTLQYFTTLGWMVISNYGCTIA